MYHQVSHIRTTKLGKSNSLEGKNGPHLVRLRTKEKCDVTLPIFTFKPRLDLVQVSVTLPDHH